MGLNAVNFFLAEVVGVIMPFLSAYLHERQWSYAQIGIASAAAGLGTLLFQTPAGFICDRVRNHRLLLAAMSALVGLCYGALPFFSKHAPWVDTLLFFSGVAGAFFVPLLATLARSLVTATRLPATMGANQSWNHAGNVTAALLALLVVKLLGIETIFFIMASVSLLAMASVFLIRGDELRDGTTPSESRTSVRAELSRLCSDPNVRVLLIAVALFHIANAPVMPLVGLYLKHLGGGDSQVAWVVVIAQVVMVPTAIVAGKYCGSMGRKPVFAVAFLVLPIRILLYAVTKNPTAILAFQALDGIGAGIYGVVIALVCSDLTQKTGGFNALVGIAQTALAIGGFIGPLCQGFLTQQFGFPATFIAFACVAAIGAAVFVIKMPETAFLPAKAAG